MRAKFIYESLGDVLKPKSRGDIHQAFIDQYGFYPSDDTLVVYVDDPQYPIQYHFNKKDNTFWKKTLGDKSLTPLRDAENRWLLSVLNGEITPHDHWAIFKSNYK